MKKFGLIGFPLAHSFSKKYYDAKIEREGLADVGYEHYPISKITDFSQLIVDEPLLVGVNITIPYKIAVMDYLSTLSPEAQAIGAVNCIRIGRPQNGGPTLIGYNTDVYGFAESLKPLLLPQHDRALVLGNGGAAKAVIYALGQLGVPCTIVSRSPDDSMVSYPQLDAKMLDEHPLIINTTPLGTFPSVDTCPEIPYEHISKKHLLYDLVYNPAQTEFLKRGHANGATIKNGQEMLELQAERNWEIWNELKR